MIRNNTSNYNNRDKNDNNKNNNNNNTDREVIHLTISILPTVATRRALSVSCKRHNKVPLKLYNTAGEGGQLALCFCLLTCLSVCIMASSKRFPRPLMHPKGNSFYQNFNNGQLQPLSRASLAPEMIHFPE